MPGVYRRTWFYARLKQDWTRSNTSEMPESRFQETETQTGKAV